MKAGVVGLGQMGRGIARNLESKGYLVACFDSDEVAVREAGLASPALSGQALVDAVDVLLFAVPSTAEIEIAIEGCSRDTKTMIIDLTTSAPADSTALADDLTQRGFSFLDAAMTGGAAGADAGSLTLMIGGTPENVKSCKPIFDAISNQSFHLGPLGSGHAMKLVHNLILHSSFLATCEGLALAGRFGLDPSQAVDVLNAGNARSFVTEVRFPRDILSGSMDARSIISNLAKDLGLAVDFARKLDGPSPYSALSHKLLSEALELGHSTRDFSHLFPLFEDIALSAKRGK